MEYIVKTNDITKKYRNHLVVQNVNLNIKKGEIYGFLGQNGAGKTTTLRMITGLIKSTSGKIQLFEKDLNNNKRNIFRKVGSIIEFPGFYLNLTVLQNLKLHLFLMGLKIDVNLIDQTLKLVGLVNVGNRKVKELSLGMKQRLGIARAIIHGPELLILDEPLNGLDPIGIREIRELLLHLAKSKGITIIMSTHILSEVEQIATTIGIIHKGVLINEISMNNIKKSNRHYIEIKVDNEIVSCEILEKNFKYTNYEVISPGEIRLFEGTNEISTINRELVNSGVNVLSINVKEDTLEDYFVKITGGSTHV